MLSRFLVLGLSLGLMSASYDVMANSADKESVAVEQILIEPGAVQALRELSVMTLQGEGTRLMDLGDKPMLVNFWATWCAPCVREMPLLDQFSQEHPEVQFVGLALDSLPNVQKFESKLKVSYPLLQAGMQTIKLVKQLGNPKGGLPFTLLLSANGEVLDVHLGELHDEDLKRLLEKSKS